jgi:hypothetical protein
MSKRTIALALAAAVLAPLTAVAQNAPPGGPHALTLKLSQILPGDSTVQRETRLSLWDSPVWRLEYYARRQGAYGDQLMPGTNKVPWRVLAGAEYLGFHTMLRPGVMVNTSYGRDFRQLTSGEAFARDLGGLLLLNAMAKLADILNHH